MDSLSPYIIKILEDNDVGDSQGDSNCTTHLNNESLQFLNFLGIHIIHYFMENYHDLGMQYTLNKLLKGELARNTISTVSKIDIIMQKHKIKSTRDKTYKCLLSVHAVETIINNLKSDIKCHYVESIYFTYLLEYLYSVILCMCAGFAIKVAVDENALYAYKPFYHIITKDIILNTISNCYELFQLFKDIGVLQISMGVVQYIHRELPVIKCNFTKIGNSGDSDSSGSSGSSNSGSDIGSNSGSSNININFKEELSLHLVVMQAYLQKPEIVEMDVKLKQSLLIIAEKNIKIKKGKSLMNKLVINFTTQITKFSDCLDAEVRKEVLSYLSVILSEASNNYKLDVNYI